VFWDAPSNLPNCVSVEKYTVIVTLKLPNATRQQEEIVPGNKTAATLQVRGFPSSWLIFRIGVVASSFDGDQAISHMAFGLI
jgi:hypothetical protein